MGEGELPVREMLTRLATRGFTGHISLDWEKMWHTELASADEALPYHAARLREYLGAIQGTLEKGKP